MKKLSNVTLVKRDYIPSIHTIEVNGVEHWLGHVKDFMKNKQLLDFLPDDNRISMAWVRLEAGEELEPHIHPVESMILLCEGSAESTGDIQAAMDAGDALLVPPGHLHGFKGGHPNGFWGLSIQFDSRGLYEDFTDPWATFHPEQVNTTLGNTVAEQLFSRNEIYMERFDKHKLFALVNRGLLKKTQTKKKFLDCFQVWSDYFQKMVLARATTLNDATFEEITMSHLEEELGHNRDLKNGRVDFEPVFDPILEAASSWFTYKMSTATELEKVVLVHLVVEASATFFYKHIKPVMDGSTTKTHFDVHSVLDDEHVRMGYEFISKCDINDGKPLFEIQNKGWAMLMTVMSRIADLTVYENRASEELTEDECQELVDAPAMV
ncbi:cupin domain-containing protein [Xenorhabdus bovienii]|uniref:Cupin domain-containing protein n=1 Tax=Xenorhabdus bovienii TaxID=40576 RepID=A0AAJ1J5S1_XENBV|nr:cupin domain-containing protein [Xenorhabdus bovienii]MDE1476707.1 cupin domain-containing protein [Xenorhabdus bovienii]MDE1489318.1 cupin domain-containing protein [Xenorhabdus bovienii]MDE1494655.1 cupin domain-containing protein [Xenorhabdus bovienii]MDE9472821.1 cupin domain-containing protein [Xenorhabdus bovienii]MDE9508459.1 cupin domain-containing protein [Xenorhabdus bovienii]